METVVREEVIELDLTDNSLLFEITISYNCLNCKYSLGLKLLLYPFYNLIPECSN